MGVFLDFKIIYDNSLIIAIIAINMTIIGLTPLAETKNIVGIDYGKFLIKKYKLFNVVSSKWVSTRPTTVSEKALKN